MNTYTLRYSSLYKPSFFYTIKKYKTKKGAENKAIELSKQRPNVFQIIEENEQKETNMSFYKNGICYLETF